MTTPPEPSPLEPSPPAPSPPAPPKKSKLPWILGGAALAFLVIIGVVIAIVVNTVLGTARAPQEVIGEYDRAFDEVDCELYLSITTEAYQESFEPTCEGFEATAQNFLDSYTDYKVTVTGTSVSGDTATVETSETFVFEGEPGTDLYTYSLVKSDGVWLIDSLVVE